MKTIFQDIFERGENSDRIAVISDETQVDYQTLVRSSLDLAKSLSSKLPRCPIVAISANHGLAYIQGLLACIALDAIIVPINPSAAPSEKLHVLDNSNADALLQEESEFLWGVEGFSGFNLHLYLPSASRVTRPRPQNGRMLIYSSGTTNRPKGVLLSDRSLSSNIRAVANNFGLSPGDRTIVFSPPAYAMAMTQIFSYLWVGGSIVCWPHGLRYPAEIVRLIEEYKLTGLTLSPSAVRIIQKVVNLESKIFPTLRYVSSGGMPLYPKDIKWYCAKFPNARVINFYGCTENSPRISHYWVPLNLDIAGDSVLPVGQPLEGVEIMVADPQGDALPPNTIGEIYLKGSSLMEGYWHNEEFSTLKFHNDWFKTGDEGMVDSAGNLSLSGRVDNVFSVGHEKVAPEEIEALIAQLAGVDEVVVGRLPDVLLDSVPVALVVASRELSTVKNDILDQCRKNLSPVKMPREILFTKEIPKTLYGKIDRRSTQSLIERLISEKMIVFHDQAFD